MAASCAATALFILTITAEFIYAQVHHRAFAPPCPSRSQNGVVRIPVATVNDGNLHRFSIEVGRRDGAHHRHPPARPVARHRFRRLRDLRQSGLLPERAERDLQELRVGDLRADHRRTRAAAIRFRSNRRVEGDQLVIPADKLLARRQAFPDGEPLTCSCAS